MISNKNEIKFKVVLMGDSSVGKTTLLNKYITGNFEDKLTTTVGTDVKYSNEILDGKTFKIMIWDTAGQEIYRSVSKNYYKNSLGILLLYSIDNRNSFLNVENWLKEVNENKNYEIVVFLIGNKSDLDFERAVNYEEGYELAKKYGFHFFETSAKDTTNQEISTEIREIFLKLIREINKKIEYIDHNITEREINLIPTEQPKKCSC